MSFKKERLWSSLFKVEKLWYVRTGRQKTYRIILFNKMCLYQYVSNVLVYMQRKSGGMGKVKDVYMKAMNLYDNWLPPCHLWVCPFNRCRLKVHGSFPLPVTVWHGTHSHFQKVPEPGPAWFTPENNHQLYCLDPTVLYRDLWERHCWNSEVPQVKGPKGMFHYAVFYIGTKISLFHTVVKPLTVTYHSVHCNRLYICQRSKEQHLSNVFYGH